ncbi:MAG: phosphoribosylamine--glycine ligase [Dehalococcoidia bacterium]|nr:phosphoribosylamine--glycine ligase [Dehalococcoidia bacterium]
MTSPLNVLLLGSGGREHAIAWKLAQSSLLAKLWVAPGNAGTGDLGENVPEVVATDLEGVAALAKRVRADLVIVGPEDPLAAGVVDRLTVEGIRCFGPTRAAAEIEWSKRFAKDLMRDAGIPTAEARAFDSTTEAYSYLRRLEDARGVTPVIKADGLAAGKGVVLAADFEEARAAVDAAMVSRAFGDAGTRVLIEERMSGPETSAHAFTDGVTVRHMPFSCDHKPVFDGDHGPNTGGMGVYSPPGWLLDTDARAIERDVTERTVRALFEAGRPYRGVLYPGMMMTSGGPRVVEYNCRFGDPETEALLPRLESDLVEICWAVATNTLDQVEVRWSERATVGVMMAAGGYPGPYSNGARIDGVGDVDDDVQVFMAGAQRDALGHLVTAGGRVLCVTASGATIAEARDRAYDNVRRIHFDGAHYRSDIGARPIGGTMGLGVAAGTR